MKPVSPNPTSPVTRIYVTTQGDLIVTDMWQDVETWLGEAGFLKNDSNGQITGGNNDENN